METNKYQLKYEQLVDEIASICCNALNGDYCKHCWKFGIPGRVLCFKCDALTEILDDLHSLLDSNDVEHLIDNLLDENIKLKEYKDSKQASYETMQRQWNEAINKSRRLEVENQVYKASIIANLDKAISDRLSYILNEIDEINNLFDIKDRAKSDDVKNLIGADVRKRIADLTNYKIDSSTLFNKHNQDKLDRIQEIILSVITRRPHSDNAIFEKILGIIEEGQKND